LPNVGWLRESKCDLHEAIQQLHPDASIVHWYGIHKLPQLILREFLD
jgi:hypothetical protein